MRSRTFLFAVLLVAGSLALPFVAHAAGIPFFGPIIPKENATCAAGWGMLITVVNNVISLLITLAIVFVAPLMIAWAGFLLVVSQGDSGKRTEARKILTNTIVGIVIALCGWLIVDAVMVVLYNGTFGTWSSLVTSGGAPVCIPLVESTAPVVTQPPAVVTPPPGTGRFTYDPGIQAQTGDASAALNTLLSCMESKVSQGVGRISSISDSLITSGQKTIAQCALGGCQHGANSCHYGGRLCVGKSYAVDFGDEQNATALTSAARACGANYVGNEGNHLHISVGSSCGCN